VKNSMSWVQIFGGYHYINFKFLQYKLLWGWGGGGGGGGVFFLFF
jgi:hypothetical protein